MGKGHICNSVMANDQIKKLDCHDVLYVPDLRTNLTSVRKILYRGYQVNFYCACAEVISEKSENVTFVADCTGDLYYLGTNGVAECKTVTETAAVD